MNQWWKIWEGLRSQLRELENELDMKLVILNQSGVEHLRQIAEDPKYLLPEGELKMFMRVSKMNREAAEWGPSQSTYQHLSKEIARDLKQLAIVNEELEFHVLELEAKTDMESLSEEERHIWKSNLDEVRRKQINSTRSQLEFEKNFKSFQEEELRIREGLNNRNRLESVGETNPADEPDNVNVTRLQLSFDEDDVEIAEAFEREIAESHYHSTTMSDEKAEVVEKTENENSAPLTNGTVVAAAEGLSNSDEPVAQPVESKEQSTPEKSTASDVESDPKEQNGKTPSPRVDPDVLIENLGVLLGTTAKSALKMRISCVFEKDEDFEKSMLAAQNQFFKQLPRAMAESFFTSATKEADAESGVLVPKGLKALTLRQSLLLCFTHPTLRDHFTSEEKLALADLNDSLMRLLCLKNDLAEPLIGPGAMPDGSRNSSPRTPSKDDPEKVKKKIVDSLQGVGLQKSEMEKQLQNDAGCNKCADLWKEVEEDSLFQAAFLKHARKEIARKRKDGETLSPQLLELDAKIKSITEKDSVGLDTFFNIRQTLETQLKGILACGFCKTFPFQDPKTLPCLHSFEAKCLKDNMNSTDKTVTCQTCHTRISAPDQTAIDQLPCSFVLAGLLKLYPKTKTEDPSELECFLCIHPGTEYCLQNGQLYCLDHSVPLYHRENEQLIPATDLLNGERVRTLLESYCPQHREPLKQFCTSCLVPLCGNSACVTWHAQHGSLKSLDDASDEQKHQLRYLGSLLEKKMEKLVAKGTAAEQNQMHVADLQENVRESIVKYFADVQTHIEEKKKEFLRDLDKAAELCWHQDEHVRTSLSTWKTSAGKVMSQMESLEFLPSQSPSSHGSPVTNMSSLRRDVLGLLGDTVHGNTLAETKALSYPEGQLRSLLQSCSNMKSNIAAVSGARGWEIALKNQGIRLFLVNRNSLFAIRKTLFSGCSIQSQDLKDLNAPPTPFIETATHDFQGIALTSQGQLIVPEETQNSLELPSLKLKKSVNIVTYSANKEKASVVNVDCLNTYAKIIFKTGLTPGDALRSTKIYIGDDQCICELDDSGQVLRKFDFYTMVSICDFAPEPQRDILLVTDSTKHNLLIFNCRQQQMITVGDQGATPGSFLHPSGVAVDAFGHVFVADGGNSRVQVFDFSGKFLKLIQYPQSLRDHVSGPNIPINAMVHLQAYDDYLYMLDSRCNTTIYRVKYM